MKLPLLAAFVLVAAILAAGLQTGHAATIVIINNDGPGEGFNDPTPVAPVGGNPGTTLGEQRMFAFVYAANLWGQCLTSYVEIEVEAQMDSLLCTETSAILGSAAATFVHRDWVVGDPPPKANTWYPQALANCIARTDLNPFTPEVTATFNSNLTGDPSCLGGIGWYYGVDRYPGSDVDFVTVVFHEIGHGLGFQPMIDLTTGAKFMGFDDAYESNMGHHFHVPADYPSMTDAERASCNTGDPDLHWTGIHANNEAAMLLSYGISNGHTRLYGPATAAPGASLAHWHHLLFPDRVMEPFYTGANHDATLELQLLKDLGWSIAPKEPVATWFSGFDATVTDEGVELVALFFSDVPRVTATVYRNHAAIFSRDAGGDVFRYIDSDAIPGATYTYRIGVRDGDGEFFTPPRTIRVPDARAALAQNTPNPFNPSTTIHFVLADTRHARLSVYDAGGALVTTLVDGTLARGAHVAVWDGTDALGNPVASGVYHYRLVAGRFTESKKMVLVK